MNEKHRDRLVLAALITALLVFYASLFIWRLN